MMKTFPRIIAAIIAVVVMHDAIGARMVRVLDAEGNVIVESPMEQRLVPDTRESVGCNVPPPPPFTDYRNFSELSEEDVYMASGLLVRSASVREQEFIEIICSTTRNDSRVTPIYRCEFRYNGGEFRTFDFHSAGSVVPRSRDIRAPCNRVTSLAKYFNVLTDADGKAILQTLYALPRPNPYEIVLYEQTPLEPNDDGDFNVERFEPLSD